MSDTDERNHRPDIDGLRAIAVISVILFHIDKTLLPGGFVGVDIFFVISGYLISLHILRDLERGRFSLVEFYRRRIKRIAPAMLVVVAVTLLLTQLVFRPEDAELVAQSSLWSLSSLANVYFWLHQDTSYFAAASNEKPLLHLWSLGVEEQFYLIWPLLLLVVYNTIRNTNRTKWLFVASIFTAVSSFVLGQFLFEYSPSFVYYMLPTRAGELLVGAVAAQIVLRLPMPAFSSGTVTPLALLGLILIGGAFVLLSEDQVFPGLLAIPPTLGTALLILAGQYGDSPATRWLKLPPMIWVGLISYSAYLWHWPLLAFLRYGGTHIGPVAGITAFVVTMLLAWLSYRYVETPARRSQRSAIQILASQYLIPAFVLCSISVAAMKVDGYGLRWMSAEYKADLAEVRERTRPAYEFDYVCQKQRINAEDLNDNRCIVGAQTDASPAAILWGDSNAAHYIGMLAVFARAGGFRFRNVELGSCPPIDTDPADFVQARRIADCRDSSPPILHAIDAHSVVIVSAFWSFYQARSDQFLDAFFATARRLTRAGKLVVILGQVPPISTYDGLCREKALSFPFLDTCDAPGVPIAAEVAAVNERLKTFADDNPNIEYFDVEEYLCPAAVCSAFDKDGRPLYFDRNHLLLTASWEIGYDLLRRDGLPTPFKTITNWRHTPMATHPPED